MQIKQNFTIPGNRITVLKIALESLYWWIRNENKQTTFFRSDSRSWLSLRMLQTFVKLQYLKLWCLQATVPLIFAINSKVNRSISIISNYVMIVLESNKGKRRRALQFWKSWTRQRRKSAAIYCLFKFRLPAWDEVARHRQWEISMETFFDSTQAECIFRQTMKPIKTTLNFTAKVTILARPLAVGSLPCDATFRPTFYVKREILLLFDTFSRWIIYGFCNAIRR